MEFNATIIVAFISFIIFIIIMNQILYKPIYDIVEKRKKFIDENYLEAQKNSDKKEAILKEREDELDSANRESRQRTLETLDSLNLEKKDTILQAKKDAQNIIKNNQQELEQEKKDAQDILKNNVYDFAQNIVDKFIIMEEKVPRA